MDDILWINHNRDDVLNKLNGYMSYNLSSVGSPDMYLGTKLKCMQLHTGIWAWSMSPSMYVQKAVSIYDVAKYLSKGYNFPRMADNPFAIGYCPKFDVSSILG